MRAESWEENQMIIWLGFDGFDYSFQIDYVSYWNRIVKAFGMCATIPRCL